jgi:hypothetical protein
MFIGSAIEIASGRLFCADIFHPSVSVKEKLKGEVLTFRRILCDATVLHLGSPIDWIG